MPERISYAQNHEDVRAWRTLRHVPRPTYLEVGASHPVLDSVTAALHADGWRGVLVEADPDLAATLRAQRTEDLVVAAAAVAVPGPVLLDVDAERGQAAVVTAGGTEVPGVRLSDVLAEHGVEQVHFASVDVEGAELQALEGLDLARWRPWLLCVEATMPDTREPALDWEPLVLGHDYRYVATDGLNRWYVAQEHPELAERAAVPFGVLDRMLDGWVPYREVQLQAAVRVTAELEQRVRELEVERDAALARERSVVDSRIWRASAPVRRVLDRSVLVRRLIAPEPPPVVQALPELPHEAELQAGLRARLAARQRPAA